jgi:DNA adenine methylase
MKGLIFFPYMGGKFYMVNYVVRLIPEHGVYVEPFCGSAKVLFAKKPSKVEIINDYDKKIANLFYVVMFKFDEFYKKINKTVYSRALFLDFREEVKDYSLKKLGDVDYAVYVYYLLCASFSCNMSSFAISKEISNNKARAFFSKVDNLSLIHNRLKNVVIESQDFEEIIRRYDTEDTFFYVDPPYFGSEHYYQLRFTERDHKRLIRILKEVKGKWLLSSYSNDLYEISLKDYYRLEIERAVSSYGITRKTVKREKPRAREVLWANYDIYKLAELNCLRGVEIYDRNKKPERLNVFSIDCRRVSCLF